MRRWTAAAAALVTVGACAPGAERATPDVAATAPTTTTPPRAAAPPTTAATRTVAYYTGGTSKLGRVAVLTPAGVEDLGSVDLPLDLVGPGFGLTYEFHAGDPLGIEVVNEDDGWSSPWEQWAITSIVCSIEVDGVVVDVARASGLGEKVSCEGYA
jgi:hypothetical protein